MLNPPIDNMYGILFIYLTLFEVEFNPFMLVKVLLLQVREGKLSPEGEIFNILIVKTE